jgi:hypothetical protein
MPSNHIIRYVAHTSFCLLERTLILQSGHKLPQTETGRPMPALTTDSSLINSFTTTYPVTCTSAPSSTTRHSTSQPAAALCCNRASRLRHTKNRVTIYTACTRGPHCGLRPTGAVTPHGSPFLFARFQPRRSSCLCPWMGPGGRGRGFVGSPKGCWRVTCIKESRSAHVAGVRPCDLFLFSDSFLATRCWQGRRCCVAPGKPVAKHAGALSVCPPSPHTAPIEGRSTGNMSV